MKYIFIMLSLTNAPSRPLAWHRRAVALYESSSPVNCWEGAWDHNREMTRPRVRACLQTVDKWSRRGGSRLAGKRTSDAEKIGACTAESCVIVHGGAGAKRSRAVTLLGNLSLQPIRHSAPPASRQTPNALGFGSIKWAGPLLLLLGIKAGLSAAP